MNTVRVLTSDDTDCRGYLIYAQAFIGTTLWFFSCPFQVCITFGFSKIPSSVFKKGTISPKSSARWSNAMQIGSTCRASTCLLPKASVTTTGLSCTAPTAKADTCGGIISAIGGADIGYRNRALFNIMLRQALGCGNAFVCALGFAVQGFHFVLACF